MTATVETITEQLDMAAALPPSDQPPMATAHTVTLTDTDVATATADVSIVCLQSIWEVWYGTITLPYSSVA